MQKISPKKGLLAAFIVLAVIILIVSFLKTSSSPKKSYKSLIKLETRYGGKNKKIVIEDLKMASASKFSGKITPPPFIPVGKYNRLKGPLKIVFGISGGDVNNLKETLGNIYYVLRYVHYNHLKYKMAVVIYGKMASQLNPKIKGGYFNDSKMIFQDFNYAHKHGVKFYVCYNALMLNHLIHKQIPYFVKPVPMGLLKIYELREEGYLYFTNP
jgi:intracellular sulfur oxidation DsrE/DsrF family protein